MLEKIIEKKVTDYAKSKGFFAVKQKSDYQRGLPDRYYVNPNGVIIFVEFKALGKKPTPRQQLIINELLKHNCLVFVIDNIEDGIKLINKYKELYA